MKLRIPADPREFLYGHMVFVMGAGRTGTTITANLIGSLKPVFHLFEPVMLRTMLPLFNKPRPVLERAFLVTLFEDYIMPVVQGRKIDPWPEDKTYWGNYGTEPDLIWRCENFRTRSKALRWINAEKPWWLIKLPELQPFAWILDQLFPGSHFIHTIRDGRWVVASCAEHNWYCDKWCKDTAVEWTVGDKGCPWYMPRGIREAWDDWNEHTRAAAVWRITTALGIRFCGTHSTAIMLKLEKLRQEPEKTAEFFTKRFNVRWSDVTQTIIDRISKFEQAERADPTELIAEPERSKFVQFNKELGYV